MAASRTSLMVKAALPLATLVREIQSDTAKMAPRLSEGWPHSAARKPVCRVRCLSVCREREEADELEIETHSCSEGGQVQHLESDRQNVLCATYSLKSSQRI